MTLKRVALSMVIVLGSLTVLVVAFAAVASRTICHLGDHRREYTSFSIKGIGEAVQDFARSEGYYPDAKQGMALLVQRGYLIRKPVDAWGNDYDYSVNADSVTVKSYGADGKEGGTDAAADIVQTFPKLEPHFVGGKG